MLSDIAALEAKAGNSKSQLLHAIDSALADGSTWHKLQASQRDVRSIVKSIMTIVDIKKNGR